MIKMFLTLVMIALTSSPTNAQSVIFSENFEGFSSSQRVVCQNQSDWVLWSKPPCDTVEDPFVSSNYAYSGTNSVVTAQNNDLVKTFGPFTSGKWETSWQMYIPIGKSGYFNTLHHFSDSCYYCSKWAMQVFFNSNGTGTVDAGSQNAASFSYTQGNWVSVRVLVDLDIDQAQLWLEGSMIIQWQWSIGWNGQGGLLQLNATDFYGFAATDEMYIDNYTIKDLLHFSSTLILSNGWNLVSFPGIHPNSMLADTLYKYRDLSSSAFGYDGTGYVSLDTLKNGFGYWLNHNGTRTYNWNSTVQNGILYPQLAHALIDTFNGTMGWNLIGCYDYSFLTDSIKTDPPGLISGYPYRYVTNQGYGLATVLQPGNGYWVYLTGDGKIIYPNRPALLKQPTEQIISDKWIKIIVTDAKGNQKTLYLTKEEISLYKFQLPPKPPTGIFDIRYTTDRMVEDLSTDKVIEISGAAYPIKVKSEGISFKLTDGIDGNMLNTILKDGNTIIIDDSRLSRIKIAFGEVTPTDFNLEQNYPNPFNPITTIKYQLAEDGYVRLAVFDIIGNEVAELINEKQNKGRYGVEFDGNQLSSGVYLYKLQAGKFVQTRKMILMK